MTTIAELSNVSLPNGDVISKYDLVAIVNIYNKNYFHVYRRYNNVHEFIIQDETGDLFFHSDCTVRESLQQLLCLTYEKTSMLYVIDAFSFLHNSTPPTMIDDIPDMLWSDIQMNWHTVSVNFGGILQDFHHAQSAFVPTVFSFSFSYSPSASPSASPSQTQMNLNKRFFSQMDDESSCYNCGNENCKCD
jgi:hypothetical protein